MHHGQDLPAELPAEQGGAGQQGDDRLGQQGEPLPDSFPHAGRNGGDRAPAVPEPGGLLDEEGVAAGAAVDLVDQLRGGLAARCHRHQRPHLVPAEAGQGEGRGGARDQRQDQLLERVPGGVHLDVPVGADQQQPLEPGVLGGEFEQAQGGRVGAVQIVEDDHQRSALGDRDEGRGHGVEEPEGLGPLRRTAVRRARARFRAGLSAARRVGTRGSGGARGRPRKGAGPRSVRTAHGDPDRVAQERGEPAFRRLLGRCPFGRGGGPAQAAQDLDPGPVAGSVVRVPAGTSDHQCSAPPCLVRGVGDERALADSGLTGDQHETAVAVRGPGDLRAENACGVVAPEESRGHDHTIGAPTDNGPLVLPPGLLSRARPSPGTARAG